MRIFLTLAITTLLFTCTTLEEGQPSDSPAEFEDGSTALLGVIDCSNIGEPEYERNCLEQLYKNRNLLDDSQRP